MKLFNYIWSVLFAFSVQGGKFEVKAGSLGFSITIFTVVAILAVALILARRYLSFFGRGELGGPVVPGYISAAFLVFLWVVYILLSSLESYGIIPGF